MKSAVKQKARKLLTSVGLRLTRPRLAILSILLNADKPVTHEQIFTKLGRYAPNKVTIYRVLDCLLQAGIVHKAYLTERAWHFELAHNCTDTQCHPHFTCTSCDETHCLTDAAVPMAKAPKGFTIYHQRIQLEGLCPKCST